jgi:tetratricopeptide (TPR) repeat protein
MTGLRQDLAGASVLVNLKRYDEAASLLARIVAAYPGNTRAWCLLANARLGTGQYREAADAARRTITLAPANDWAYRLASIADRHLGNDMAALTAAIEACKLAPDQWHSYACLAQAELARGYEAAERAAARTRELAPDEPEVHYVSGLISYQRSDLKAARAHQERALALNPAHSGALNELGRIKLRRQNLAGAVQHFIQAAQSAPGERIYGRNVDVVIVYVIVLVIYFASFVTLTLAGAAATHLSRIAVVTGLVVMAVLCAGFGAVQLWRMPPETHPLFRTRRIVLALVTVYGSLLIAVAVAVLTPIQALPGTLLVATALIFLSQVAVAATLRHKRSSIGGQTRGT